MPTSHSGRLLLGICFHRGNAYECWYCYWPLCHTWLQIPQSHHIVQVSLCFGFFWLFFYVSTASSGILYNLWHNAAEIWGCVWAFLPSKSSCNHKLQATNELSHDVKGNCPKKCNVLMEISCTAKYTVSECILNLSGGFLFYSPVQDQCWHWL